MKVDKEARRQLAITNAKQPSVLVRVPREQWPANAYDPKRAEVWRSAKFLVQVFAEVAVSRISVCRTDLGQGGRWQDKIEWDDLQRIKSEIGCGHMWAVEVYPADVEVVNVANMRHLWLLPEPPPFAWRKGEGV